MGQKDPLLNVYRESPYLVVSKNALLLFESLYVLILMYAFVDQMMGDDKSRSHLMVHGGLDFTHRIWLIFGSLVTFLLGTNLVCAESWKMAAFQMILLKVLIARTVTEMNWQMSVLAVVLLVMQVPVLFVTMMFAILVRKKNKAIIGNVEIDD